MKWLSNLSIKYRLWSGIGLVAAGLFVVAALSIQSLRKTDSTVTTVLHDTEAMQLSSDLKSYLVTANASLAFFLLSKEQQHWEKYLHSLEQSELLIIQLREQPAIQHHEQSQILITTIAELFNQFKSYQSQMLTLASDDNANQPGFGYSASSLNPLSQQMMQAVSEAISAEEDEDLSEERRQLLSLLNELRYAWANVMSEVRAYVAFRGETAVNNANIYIEHSGNLLDQIYDQSFLLNFLQEDGIDQFAAVREQFVENFKELQQLHSGEQWRQDSYLIRTELGPLEEQIEQNLNQLIQLQLDSVEQDSENLLALLSQANGLLWFIVIIGVGIAVFVAFSLNLTVVKPLVEAVNAMNNISQGEGDLTQRLNENGKDELAQLGKGFNSFAGKIQRIIQQIIGFTDSFSESARQMKDITEISRQGAVNQQSEIQQITSSVSQMTNSVQQVGQHATDAAHFATSANHSADDARKVVETTININHSLSQEVQSAALVIEKVATDSNNISTVTNVINEIAEQTNLLALNAAIEAARAGEQGRGFAVVADEVRSLAQRTQESTNEIRDMVEQLQRGAHEAVQAMETGQEKAKNSVEQVTQAGTALDTINEAIAKISEMNSQIASVSEEQQAVAQTVDEKISRIGEVANSSVDGADKTSTMSQELANLSEELKKLVHQFKV